MTTACGIDFGTSNSAIAVPIGGEPALVDQEHGRATIPTALFFDAETNHVRFGRHAIRNYVEGTEGRLMRGPKSILGSALVDETTLVQGSAISYKDVIAAFLRHIKTVAENDTNCPLDVAVIGRPVFFVDGDAERDLAAQRTLEACARSAGFADVQFEFEPIAAALDFETGLTREQITLVIDIGGGTSDFSVVRLGPGRAREASRTNDILANLGVHVGGTDFDQQLSLNCVMPLLGYKSPGLGGLTVPASVYFDLSTWHRINLLHSSKSLHEVKAMQTFYADMSLHGRLMKVLTKRLGHLFLGRVEEAKIVAAEGACEAGISLDEVEPGLAAAVASAVPENVLADSYDRIMETAKRAVGLAGLTGERIGTLYFTGGSTALPALRRRFRSAFPDSAPVFGDPFGSVAKGLALKASRTVG